MGGQTPNLEEMGRRSEGTLQSEGPQCDIGVSNVNRQEPRGGFPAPLPPPLFFRQLTDVSTISGSAWETRSSAEKKSCI